MPVSRIPIAAAALAAALVSLGRPPAGVVHPAGISGTDVQQASASLPLSAESWQLTSLNLPSAWQATTGRSASAAVVAVVDSGVSPDAAGLEGRLLPGYDLINMDADAVDDNGHGTMIAEIIASTCPACRILPVKVLGPDHTGTWPTAAQGIVWAADHGAQVINLSLGAAHAPDEVGPAVAYAVSKGIIVVAAAGNDGRNEAFYPATYPGVVSVAGVDENASRYAWSNYGPWVTVEAPGCAPENGGAAEFCGTSAAAPFIAGIAGLARTVAPDLTPGTFASELRAASPAPLDPSTAGAGLPDATRLLNALAILETPPVVVARPTASGALAIGRRLTAGAGRWQFAASYTVRWQRSRDGRTWRSVATGPSYVVSRRDAGFEFRALVTARNAHGTTTSASDAVRVAGKVRVGASGAGHRPSG